MLDRIVPAPGAGGSPLVLADERLCVRGGAEIALPGSSARFGPCSLVTDGSRAASAGGRPANSPGMVGANASAGTASMRSAPSARERTSAAGSEPFQPA
ncbi:MULTISPECIES: hypothetical protein [unclassified Streptomyces]|uniref:hypothetical protein n=1 Tax=unclassified Streptomyces TaxID=2593676 RepID=UPI00211C1DF4|nr:MULTISPECIES: hypothetical protein [unclassified Streptomyces]